MPTPRELELAEALGVVRARLAAAARAAGREIDEIELLPVTKFFPAADVVVLRRLGCESFGESRAQEAAEKVEEIASMQGVPDIRWHMVGRIQRNKARAVAGWAYAAHSVDSRRLIDALSRAAADALEEGRRAEPLRVFLQLSLDGDESRGGVDIDNPELVDELCAAVHDADGLEFVGLMAVPPLGADADDAFARLHAEHRRLQAGYPQRLGLSAGMSGDLEAAVKHGSTCVRVGTALLGQRPLPSPEVVTPVTYSSQTPQSRA
ncbi:YggS family pyridoxal phosphate-dependent enzyme [Mycobacterium sp. E740]|uniref:YggS family pyridoxal phosphate-dependent enzyme n=1 Tax=Mycobacterium sp. E740 TaxID=1834149 RepID=UPI0007FE01DA|nr:YggS family pyridoxal phosphate-dependent enzyme [Mycobacterium sp. E740]OBI79481.1 YggS family pyridoxal phosphate enzyme [Mycobacterium sp. E740]